MLPSHYEYYNPVKIISGHQALENIPFELNFLGAKRPLVITDKGIVEAGLVKVMLKAAGGSDLVIGALYEDTPPDSSNVVVNKIAAIYRENRCDSLIALGGGSVLDTAKGVNIVITEKTDDLMNFLGADRLTKKMQPFIAVPTTSGTGSEVTVAAVITNVDKNIKMGFTSPLLYPDVAILDSRMTLTVPPRITAMTGMDALTHAVEAYSCIQKNPVSDAHAVAAINLIREYLVATVKDGKNKAARLAMANASLLAGCAFSNSMVGIVHGIGHALGGVCKIPHGLAMAIILPYGMEYNMAKCAPYYGELLLPLAGPDIYSQTMADKRAQKAVEAIRNLNHSLNALTEMPVNLARAGVKKEQFPEIVSKALDDGALSFNPREVEEEDVMKILKAAY